MADWESAQGVLAPFVQWFVRQMSLLFRSFHVQSSETFVPSTALSVIGEWDDQVPFACVPLGGSIATPFTIKLNWLETPLSLSPKFAWTETYDWQLVTVEK